MAHHKRRRPPNRRAGCLLCHPYKVTGCKLKNKYKPSDQRKMIGWNKENQTIQN